MTNSVFRSTAPGSSNRLGNPVVAVPSGFLGDWPTSLHLTGRLFADAEILGLASGWGVLQAMNDERGKCS